jgi:hypothetical protein
MFYYSDEILANYHVDCSVSQGSILGLNAFVAYTGGVVDVSSRRGMWSHFITMTVVCRHSLTLFILGVHAKEIRIRDQKNMLKHNDICTIVILEKIVDIFQPQRYGDNVMFQSFFHTNLS